MPRKPKAPSITLQHVHETHESVSTISLTPPHLPRTETPIYKATHERLVIQEDRPCFVCGVRHSDLQDEARRADPKINPKGSVQQESHHWPIERSLLTGIDRERLAQDYPTVRQFKSLEEWVDSEFNMLVLCDQCHRGEQGIHHVLPQDFFAAKYAIRDAEGEVYIFAATEKDAAKDEAEDAKILAEVEGKPAA